MKKLQTSLLIFLSLLLVIPASQLVYRKWYCTYKIYHNLNMRYPVIEHKPIVVVITSYKNQEYAEANIRSVLEQTYDNFRVVFIDDHSPDQTFDIVSDIVKKSGKEERFTLQRNASRKMKFSNIYKAFHACKDEEIICVLDGDDKFSDKYVLDKINRFYQNPEVWLTYGTTVTHPDYKKWGKRYPDHYFLKQKIRDLKEFCLCPLRTFYAGLFKQIKLADFYYKGQFLTSADDPAYMYPMIEMGPTHALYVKDIFYITNFDNPISDHNYRRSLQKNLHQYIQTRPKYPILPPSFDPRKTKREALSLDVAILSDDSPHELAISLTKLEPTLVLYSAKSEQNAAQYKELSERFPKIRFIENRGDLHEAFSAPFVAFCKEPLKGDVDLHQCLTKMQQTGAKSVFLGNINSTLTATEIGDDFRALSNLAISDYFAEQRENYFVILSKDDAIHSLKKGNLEATLTSLLEQDLSLFLSTK